MKKFVGQVISTKMAKTVVVEISRYKVHPIYRKRIKVKKNYHVHDEIGVKLGDRVIFEKTRPMSKTKKWKVTEVIK